MLIQFFRRDDDDHYCLKKIIDEFEYDWNNERNNIESKFITYCMLRRLCEFIQVNSKSISKSISKPISKSISKSIFDGDD